MIQENIKLITERLKWAKVFTVLELQTRKDKIEPNGLFIGMRKLTK